MSTRCIQISLTTTLLVPLLLGAATAQAQPAPAPVVQAEQDAAAPLFSGHHLAAVTGVSESPAIIAGLSWGAALLGAGVELSNEKRADAPAGEPAKLGGAVIASIQYALLNRAPVALGPELGWRMNVSGPGAFKEHWLLPGLGFWYAPFKAPILLGCAWSLRITKAPGKDTTVALTTPGLRVAFGFF